MRDRKRTDDDENIDQVYRAAVAAVEDPAAAQRRKRSVLEAVQALRSENATPAAARGDAAQAVATRGNHDRPASNQAWWCPSAAWWRGMAAACVIASSAVLVMHWGEEQGLDVQMPRDSTTANTVQQMRGADSMLNPEAPTAAETVQSAGQPMSQTTPPPAAATQSKNAAAAADEPLAARRARMEASAGAANSVAPVTARAKPSTSAGPAPPWPAAPQPSVPQAGTRETETLRMAPAEASAEGQARSRPAPRASVVASTDEKVQATSLAPTAASRAAVAVAAVPAPPAALLTAAAAGDFEATRRILQSTGPDEATDDDGRTALALAVLRSDVRLAKLLIDKGANRLARDRFGQTPLGYAQAGRDEVLLQVLGER